MKNASDVKQFAFPYTELRFPGENSGERILFITRESPIIHNLRLLIFSAVLLVGFILGYYLVGFGEQFLQEASLLKLPLVIGVSLIFILGMWWMAQTFRKSIFIITTRRLTKIIYTTPFTWYQFSLGLDEIEDTGSYGSSYLEALFGLGYFVARSGAAAIKNFKIVNISYARDLHNYVNKLLYAFKHHPEHINEFRPFIPDLKPGEREELFKKYPEYRTEFE